MPGSGEDKVPKEPYSKDLKAEALSTHHLMTHSPKNPWCPVCQIAKMQKRPHRRKVKGILLDKSEPMAFCRQVTADHVVSKSEISMGVTGDKDALVVGCRSTSYFDAFPDFSKDTVASMKALNEFRGTTKIVELYTDNSRELCAAADKLGIPHPTSTEYRPQSNGVAERLVRKVMEGNPKLAATGGYAARLLAIRYASLLSQ